MFCDDGPGNHTFDCSRSATSQHCYASIVGGTKRSCACLVKDCKADVDLLQGQSSECIISCRAPSSKDDICPDYDDENDW